MTTDQPSLSNVIQPSKRSHVKLQDWRLEMAIGARGAHAAARLASGVGSGVFAGVGLGLLSGAVRDARLG